MTDYGSPRPFFGMQPALPSQTGSPDPLRYPLLYTSETGGADLSNKTETDAAPLRYAPLAGEIAQNSFSQQFGNANDCHDEQGRFCETGGSSGSRSPNPETAKHAATNPKTGGRVDPVKAPTSFKSADGSVDFSQASEKEIASHFSRNYHAKVDLPGMQDPEVRSRFCLQVDKILSDFQGTGVIQGSQSDVRILCPTKEDWDNAKTGFGQPAFPTESGAWMVTDSRGWQMSLNPYAMSDMAFMESEFAKGTEWHADGVYNFEGAVTHEMGHMMENSLKWNHDSITGYYTYDKGEIGKAFEAYKEDNSDAAAFCKEATRNRAERFAEAFAAHYHGTPEIKKTEAVRKMSTLIEWAKNSPGRGKYYKEAEHPGKELKKINAELAKIQSVGKTHMNDCHDEKGQFCEGGGASGPITVNDRPGTLWHPTGAPTGEKIPPRLASEGIKPKWEGDTLPLRAKATSKRTGIGPERSVHTAEKRGKEYGYAKRVSFYQCTDVDQANEINSQLAELSDESGLVLGRVYVYKSGGRSKEAPSNAAAYHQQSGSTIGIQNGQTAQYCFKNAPYAPGAQDENAKWFDDYADKMEREAKSDPTLVKAFRRQAEEARVYRDYKAHTVQGNGVRNPTIDHEFAHALVGRALNSQPYTNGYGTKTMITNDRARTRLDSFAEKCTDFAKTEKFSVYAVSGRSFSMVPKQEAIAETYAYWKSGAAVPDDISKGLRRLETYRGPRS